MSVPLQELKLLLTYFREQLRGEKMTTIYNYDDDGNFINSQVALVDDLGNEILPDGATYLKPLEEKEGFVVKFNGDEWVYEEILQEPEPTFDELKLAKREEINRYRDATEQGGFEYLGKVFDSDQVSCIRMSSAAQAMQYAPDEATITWTTQDNSTIDLNKAQLMGLVVALAQHSNECHQKATTLKAQIDDCESKEELDKIVW